MKLNIVTNGDFQGSVTTQTLTRGAQAAGVVVPAGTAITSVNATSVNLSFTQPAVGGSVAATAATNPITAGFVVGEKVTIPDGSSTDTYVVSSLTSTTITLLLLVIGGTNVEGTVLAAVPLSSIPFTLTTSAAYIQPAIDSDVAISTTTGPGLVNGQKFTIPDGSGTDSYTVVSSGAGSMLAELTSVNFTNPVEGAVTVLDDVDFCTGWTVNANTAALASTVGGAFPTLSLGVSDPKTLATTLGGTITPLVPGEQAFVITPADSNPIAQTSGTANIIQLIQQIFNGPKAVSGKKCNLSFWAIAQAAGFIRVILDSTVASVTTVLLDKKIQIFTPGNWQFFQTEFIGLQYPYTDADDSLTLTIVFEASPDVFIGRTQSVGITGVSIAVPVNEDIFDDAERLFQNIPVAEQNS